MASGCAEDEDETRSGRVGIAITTATSRDSGGSMSSAFSSREEVECLLASERRESHDGMKDENKDRRFVALSGGVVCSKAAGASMLGCKGTVSIIAPSIGGSSGPRTRDADKGYRKRKIRGFSSRFVSIELETRRDRQDQYRCVSPSISRLSWVSDKPLVEDRLCLRSAS